MPGLVNAHTHAPMTLLRGLADDLRLDVWLMGYMMPVERAFVRPDFVALGTRLACAEMIRSGTTCFADMYYFEEAVAEAAAAAGLRALCAQTVLKFPAPDAAELRRFAGARARLHHALEGAPADRPGDRAARALHVHARRSSGRAPSWPVSSTCRCTRTWPRRRSRSSSRRREHGMPVVPWVKKQRLFDARVLAAHCVHVDEGEMRTLKDAGAGVAHNPTSNLKLGSGVAPVAKMLELGVAVGIGTDGPASNNDLDMFEEMRLAALLAKGISGDPTALPAREALAMATRIGARAMHLGDITGSLEPGKRADLIVVDLDQTHNVPRFDRDPDAVYSQLVYAAKSTDVVDVMCDGRWLMRDRRLLTLDEDELRAAARDVARRIDAFLIEREQSVLQKLIAIGGAAEEESFEVQVEGARRLRRTAVLRALAERRDHRHPRRALPPVRHLLLLRRSGPGTPAVPRGRVSRRAEQGGRRPGAADADRAVARSGVRIGAAVPLALLRAGDALAALLPRVLQAGARARGREGSPPLAGRLPRRRSSTCTSITW